MQVPAVSLDKKLSLKIQLFDKMNDLAQRKEVFEEGDLKVFTLSK